MQIEQYISKPQKAILTSTRSINLFLAGAGAGKTFLGGVIARMYIAKFPQCRGFIAANTYDQLNTSTLFRIREYWESTGMVEWNKETPNGVYVSGREPPEHWYLCKRNFDRYNNIISFCNGAIIFTGSLDNAISHYGKEFAWAILDETKDSREEDVKEIILTRLRQSGMYLVNNKLTNTGDMKNQFNPLYILTSPAKVDWINDWFSLENYMDEIANKIYIKDDYFVKELGDKFVCISSTYHNVHNVGENYINNIIANNTEERGKALIFANPFTLTGGEFYSSFDRLHHVGNVKYDPQLPLHISFDQNSVPYNSCSIWQVVDNKGIWELRAVDEIALENPRNSTEEVCEEFTYRYPHHRSGVYFYGDASGHNRSVMNKDFKHHYQIISYKLRRYLVNGSDRTLTYNPATVKRRDFINVLFEEKKPVRIIIDESCHKLIADLMYCKQAIDGSKDKSVVTDKETGEKYQKYGHMGDCFIGETWILTDRGKKRMFNIKIGDNVLTRNGYRKVIAKQNKGIRTVNTYRIGNKKITCTNEHKIFANGKFIAVANLIDRNIFCIFAKNNIWQYLLSFIMGSNFISTLMQKKPQTGIITKAGSRLMNIGKKYHCISIYGNKLMGKFQRDIRSIISTVTLQIIELKIWILSVVQNICNYIIVNIHRNIKMPIPENSLSWQYQRRLNGINQMKGENGIENILTNLFTQKNILENVLDADRNSNQIYVENLIGVQEDASLNIRQGKTGQRVNIRKKEPVRLAGKFLKRINGIQINSAHVPVRKIGESKKAFVYDITVEQDHEFFANGILVHNCFEYLVVELFKDYYND